MLKVLFYFFKNVHAPVLLPIYEELKKSPEVEIGFCLPFRGYERSIRAGFKTGEEDALRSQPVKFVERPQDFGSDVVFIADAVTDLVQDCGKIINVGHGLLSKGQYFTDSKFIHRENLEHLLLVPGEYQRERILNSGKVFIPVEAVGFPKLDKILRSGSPSREQLCRAAGLDPSRKIVLYAPTFNVELSAIPYLWTRIRELATPDRYLLIKLHSSTIPEFGEAHLKLASLQENIRFITDPDITYYMRMADVMVSDVSSAWMEFALLDKPVVLFNNPNRTEYVNYDPRDIEYAWRDMGIQVSTMEETKEAVSRSLANPDEFSPVRGDYRDKLGLPLDGRASGRVVRLMRNLIEGRIGSAGINEYEKTAVIITGIKTSDQNLSEKIEHLKSTCGKDAQFIGIGHNQSENNSGLRWIYEFELEKVLSELTYVCVIPISASVGERWLFRMINHLRRNPEIEAIVPLIQASDSEQDPSRYMTIDTARYPTALDLDKALKGALTAQTCEIRKPSTGTGVIKIKPSTVSMLAHELVNNGGGLFHNARLALDVVMDVKETPPEKMALSNGARLDDSENRITELSRSIGSIVLKETEEQKSLRLKAEEIVGRMRHFIGRGDAVRALDSAREALDVYPQCEPARVVLESIRQSVVESQVMVNR